MFSPMLVAAAFKEAYFTRISDKSNKYVGYSFPKRVSLNAWRPHRRHLCVFKRHAPAVGKQAEATLGAGERDCGKREAAVDADFDFSAHELRLHADVGVQR